MQLKHKLKGTTVIPFGLLVGAVANIIATVAGAAIIAYLAVTQKIGESAIGFISMAILLIGSVAGACCAYCCVKKQRLQICLMSGGAYYLILLAITALFFNGQYERMGISALIILIGALAVALFPTKTGSKLRFRKRVYR